MTSLKKKSILIMAHHLVVKEYQELWTSIAEDNPNYDFHLICPKRYKERGVVKAEPLDQDLLPMSCLDTVFGKQGRQHLFFYLGLYRKLAQLSPDLIYCAEEPNSFVSFQVARAAEKLNIKTVFWTSLNQRRDYTKMYGYLNVRRYLFPFVQNYVFKSSGAINATSVDAEDTLRWKGYTGKIINSPTHGVGDQFFAAEKLREYVKPPGNALRVLYLGHLQDYKGVDVLVRAVERCSAQVVLTVIGSGPELPQLKKLASKVEQTIIFQDPIYPSAVPNELIKHDVLVLPSVERSGVVEKFGRVLIEAKATGAMVIGSEVGGVPLAISDAGWLFKPGDYVQLASMLEALAMDGNLLASQKVKCGRQAFLKHSFKKIGSALFSKISQIV